MNRIVWVEWEITLKILAEKSNLKCKAVDETSLVIIQDGP